MNDVKVYKIVFPNGKVYIGQTRQRLERRWKNGNGYKECPYVYRAILKYGWENTIHELVADGLTQKEADDLKHELIAQYRAQDVNYGYNLQSGGGITRRGNKNSDTHNTAIAKAKSVPVICYDKSGQFIAEFQSAKAAAIFAHISPQEVSKVRNGTSKSAGGYVWRFKGDAFNKFLSEPSRGRKKQIKLKTATGVWYFDSATEAEKETGIAHSLILRYCKGERRPRNHYIWEFYEILGGTANDTQNNTAEN